MAWSPNSRFRPTVQREDLSGDCWEQELLVPPDLPCWPGHFPGRELLPGVLQLDWVMALVRRRVGDGARLLRIEGLKFKSPIVPRQRVVLTLRGGSAATSFGFQIADGSRVLAQGKVVVARPERGGT